MKFENQILNKLSEYKFKNLNYQEWVNCSLKIILSTINNLKIQNEFKEKQELFLDTKKGQLQKILNYSKEDFKILLLEVIADFNKNKQYLIDINLYRLLYNWIDYKILFNKHTITFIENIDFFIPNISVMEENLFIFSKNLFTIKSKIQKEIENKESQIKYINILNNKIYINQDVIKRYVDVNGLKANEYWEIRNKVNMMNANIELVQLSLMLYKENNINEFTTSIKPI